MAHIIFLLKVQTILKQLYMKPHNLYMDRMKRDIFFDEQMASLEKCNTYEAPNGLYIIR